ncbi:MAG: cation:proton antiporter [candidate division WWE3 bacterium]|nr:cation:proton antiporter [candidate division WWE3 bacterium]
MSGNFSLELLFTLLAAVVGGAVAKKLRLPLVVGYLVAGVVIGVAFKVRFGVGTLTPALAELGVAMLLFSVGLEFSLSRIFKTGRPAILGACLQILATIIGSTLIFTIFFNFSLFKALFFGSLISLSSTAIIAKSLADKGALESVYGELLIVWLLIQDLAVIPLLVIFSASGDLSGGSVVLTILLSLLKAGAFLVVVVLVGRKVIPLIFSKLAFLGSRELLTVASFAACVLLGFVTYSFGISFAVGAFLGGVMLASAELSHEIHGIIRPLRDLFAAVFFVSLGFLVDLPVIKSSLFIIIIIFIIVITIKFAVSFLTVKFLGYHRQISFKVAMGLTMTSEFAFIIAALGLRLNLITTEFYQVCLAVIILSLLVLPVLFDKADYIYWWLSGLLNWTGEKPARVVIARSNDTTNHVVLVGYGRVGKHIAEALITANIPVVIVDYNLHALKEARMHGLSFVYGDPASESVLKAAHIESARALVLAVPDVMAEELIIKETRRVAANLKIFCRAHTAVDADFLRGFNVTAVVEPELEAAKSIVEKLI